MATFPRQMTYRIIAMRPGTRQPSGFPRVLPVLRLLPNKFNQLHNEVHAIFSTKYHDDNDTRWPAKGRGDTHASATLYTNAPRIQVPHSRFSAHVSLALYLDFRVVGGDLHCLCHPGGLHPGDAGDGRRPQRHTHEGLGGGAEHQAASESHSPDEHLHARFWLSDLTVLTHGLHQSSHLVITTAGYMRICISVGTTSVFDKSSVV